MPNPETPSSPVERRWTALICKQCGGISDGPLDSSSTCPCEAGDDPTEPIENECRTVEVMPVADHLDALEKEREKTQAERDGWIGAKRHVEEVGDRHRRELKVAFDALRMIAAGGFVSTVDAPNIARQAFKDLAEQKDTNPQEGS